MSVALSVSNCPTITCSVVREDGQAVDEAP